MTKNVKKTSSKKEVKSQVKKELTLIDAATLSSADLVLKVAEILKKGGASGYICGVAGADSKVIPYVGASSIGDLLTIKYVIDKEISRLIDGQSSAKGDTAASTQQ